MFVSGLLLFFSIVAPLAAETTQFAYGVNAGDWSLTRYRVNPETGVLRHHGHLPVYKFPVALAVHPSKRFLITAIRTGNKVAVHRIVSSNGKLEEIPQSPFNAGASSPYSISIHPSGRFVYVAARWGGVVAFTMDEQSGVLTLIPGSPFAAQKRTRSVKVHPSGRFVYATNAHSNSISAYRVNQETGALNQITGSPFDTGEKGELPPDMLHIVDSPPEAGGIPFRVEIHPSGRYLFVTNRMGFSISAYKVNSDTGTLVPLQGSPFQTGGLPYGITVHPSGQFIYVTSWSNSEIWAYRFDEENGHLTLLADSPFAVHGYNPLSITFNTMGTRAYVTNTGFNTITQYSVDTSSGSLTVEETLRTRYQPFYVTLFNSESVNIEQDYCCVLKNKKGQLKLIKINPDDSQQLMQSGSARRLVAGEKTPAAVIGSQKRFVYLSHDVIDKPEESGVAVYRIDSASGVLTLLPENTFQLGFTPTSLAMDVSGRNLYAVNPARDNLNVLTVSPENGSLALSKIQSPKTGKGPVAIALDPVDRFSFIANSKENTVSVFTHIRMLSPAMYPINDTGSTFAVGKNPVALAVDPTGKTLVVANRDSNNLSVFSIHYHQGRLEAVKGSPVASGKAPVALAMHPGGKYVYVLNANSEDISVYQIDPLSGELSVVPQRVAAGKQPVTITLGSEGRFIYVQNKEVAGLRKYSVNNKNGQLKFKGVVDAGSVVAIMN